MARKRKKRADQRGMTPFKAGLIAVVLVTFAVFMAFTKANPFSNPYQLKGAFETANNLKPNSPVRIAGVEVGKVKKVEAVEEGGNGEGAAIVTMEMKKCSAAHPRGRDDEDPPARVPRGQLLRGHQAGLAVGAQAGQREDHPHHPDRGARAVRRRARPRCRATPAPTSRCS